MTISARRRRRTPEVLREEAIGAARRLLLETGPSAVTLQGVASALGMAHGNITHHFGSAGNLQAELADALIGELLDTVEAGARDLRAGRIDERGLVDLTFDQFEQTGVGQLFGWLAAQRDPRLATLYARFAQFLADLATADDRPDDTPPTYLPGAIASVVVTALGDVLIGAGLLHALGLPPAFTRERIAEELQRRRR